MKEDKEFLEEIEKYLKRTGEKIVIFECIIMLLALLTTFFFVLNFF